MGRVVKVGHEWQNGKKIDGRFRFRRHAWWKMVVISLN